MKRLFCSIAASVALLAAAFPSAASAEGILDSDDNRTYLGLRVAFEAPIPGDVKFGNVGVDLYKTGVGLDAGVVCNLPLWRNLYFEPGVSLYYNAMGIDIEALDESGMLSSAKIDASIRRFGLRIPLQVGYRFDFAPCSFSVFTGPELECGLVGRSHTRVKYQGVSESESINAYGSDGVLRRFDLMWKIGVGVTVDRYYLGLSGNLGMLNIYNTDFDGSMHENLFQLTLGYNF